MSGKMAEIVPGSLPLKVIGAAWRIQASAGVALVPMCSPNVLKAGYRRDDCSFVRQLLIGPLVAAATLSGGWRRWRPTGCTVLEMGLAQDDHATALWTKAVADSRRENEPVLARLPGNTVPWSHTPIQVKSIRREHVFVGAFGGTNQDESDQYQR